MNTDKHRFPGGIRSFFAISPLSLFSNRIRVKNPFLICVYPCLSVAFPFSSFSAVNGYECLKVPDIPNFSNRGCFSVLSVTPWLLSNWKFWDRFLDPRQLQSPFSSRQKHQERQGFAQDRPIPKCFFLAFLASCYIPKRTMPSSSCALTILNNRGDQAQGQAHGFRGEGTGC